VVSDAIQRQHYAYSGSSSNSTAGSKGISVTLQVKLGSGVHGTLVLPHHCWLPAAAAPTLRARCGCGCAAGDSLQWVHLQLMRVV